MQPSRFDALPQSTPQAPECSTTAGFPLTGSPQDKLRFLLNFAI